MSLIGLRAMLMSTAQRTSLSSKSAHIIVMFADYWLKVRRNCDTELCTLLSYPQNTRCQNLILYTDNYVYKWQNLPLSGLRENVTGYQWTSMRCRIWCIWGSH